MPEEYSVGIDTGSNYEVLENVIQDYNISATDVLLAFSNVYGLQLFSEENTTYLLQEFGCDF